MSLMNRILLSTILLCGYVLLSFTFSSNPIDRFAEITKEYKSYTLLKGVQVVVTDSAKYEWSQILCFIPADTREHGYVIQQDSLFISEASEVMSPHGNKLYRLYIKNFDAYVKGGSTQPVGQVLVKETWNVKEVAYDSLNTSIQQIRSKNDGKWYTPTTVSELFMMYKDKESPANDKGWNYGTYSIENQDNQPMLLNDVEKSFCIACHKNTKYDRIFGVNQYYR